MNYITIPYYFDYTNTNLLKISWDIIGNKHKFFSWHDRLITIQITHTKNNVKVFIHNTCIFYINSFTTSSITSAISFIESELCYIVNHYVLKDMYDISFIHQKPLYLLYGMPDYDLPTF